MGEQSVPLTPEVAERIVDDGFGNRWLRCEADDCDLQVVRPGKVQCHGRCSQVEGTMSGDVSPVQVSREHARPSGPYVGTRSCWGWHGAWGDPRTTGPEVPS